MQIRMQNAERLSGEQISQFLDATRLIEFSGQRRAELYQWVEQTLVAQEYGRQPKKVRGAIRAYLSKVTGRSLAQITRLVRWYRETGRVAGKPWRRVGFATKYTEQDVALLAEVDQVHERLSGPATVAILKREYEEFGKQKFARLAELSVSHLYNLRSRPGYRRRAGVVEGTRPSGVQIGERRRPEPQGRTGYLRVDTVHQGDWEGKKGVYHINAVDVVTQWQVVGCVEAINEQFLLPVLEAVLHQFPFEIYGLHTDNGSEYVNFAVEGLLKQWLVEFTRSRPNRAQDNALVEGKNGAVIRKYIGYGHIPAEHAEALHRFYAAYLNPYLNYHRPCGFARMGRDGRGRPRRCYLAPDYATPYQKLKSLPEEARRLKPGVSWGQLDQRAGRMSGTEWAKKMGVAKDRLLRACKSESPFPPRTPRGLRPCDPGNPFLEGGHGTRGGPPVGRA